MFLKRFEAKGFKSFADNTIIHFKHGMTGIVGPNGSGKSNIVDGLKWVLGEQSIKQLRGKQSMDFIFSGSTAREASNFAEVSLTFDNSNQLLKTPLTEITVTRKLTRGIQKNEYFINGEGALLSDIKELFVDTGLGRGSLGIISQGTVAWFTEAKPFDRRKIFEDASGIGKYNLTKKEIKGELDQTQRALDDAEISLNEATKVINRLTKQAEKAQIYLAKKEQLKQVEVSLIAQDLLEYQNTLAHLSQELQTQKASVQIDDEAINVVQQKLQLAKTKFHEIDQLLTQDNEQLNQSLAALNELQNQKTHYTNQLENQFSSNKLEEKIGALQQLIQSYQIEIAENQISATQLKQEIVTFETIKTNIKHKHDDLLRQLSTTKVDFERKQYQHRDLVDRIANKYRYDYGVKAIMNAKSNLRGIHNVLGNLIRLEPENEQAISLALGKSLKNIVVDTAQDAKLAINFLKQNRSGSAYFLPINDLKIRNFPSDHYDILNQLGGFVGTANELVEVDAKFRPVIDALLNRTIISVDLDAAFNHRKYTNGVYRIITLAGEEISPIGIISGGYNKKNQNVDLNLEQKAQELATDLTQAKQLISELQIQAHEFNLNYQENEAKLSQKNQIWLVLITKLDQLQKQVKIYQDDLSKYELQTSDADGSKIQSSIADLTIKLVQTQQRVERQRSLVQTNAQLKSGYSLDINAYENELSVLMGNFAGLKETINELELRHVRISNLIENNSNRLLEHYQLTPEFAIENFKQSLNMPSDVARTLVRQLREEIQDMGNVNLEAATELAARQSDYESKQKAFAEIEIACKNLQAVINELNQKALQSFRHVIEQANLKLPEIFAYLFGGGTCEIIYEDPENILESGIDIKAYLPGKTVSNLMLFSGGEKTLIALSVLFAVLQVSRLPLVILDEAESALDPANVERFANIIQSNSKKTQFIMITHRPGTMERCDVLYGITMMVKGISKVVAVELKHALEYIEEQK